jgi:hypothetical protein
MQRMRHSAPRVSICEAGGDCRYAGPFQYDDASPRQSGLGSRRYALAASRPPLVLQPAARARSANWAAARAARRNQLGAARAKYPVASRKNRRSAARWRAPRWHGRLEATTRLVGESGRPAERGFEPRRTLIGPRCQLCHLHAGTLRDMREAPACERIAQGLEVRRAERLELDRVWRTSPRARRRLHSGSFLPVPPAPVPARRRTRNARLVLARGRPPPSRPRLRPCAERWARFPKHPDCCRVQARSAAASASKFWDRAPCEASPA